LIHNFSSGPAILPKEVFEEASRAILDLNGSGLSVLEIGHRSELFLQIMHDARALAKELMQLDDDHEVLFLHGGATTQFMQVPMNLLGIKDSAGYADTDLWSAKAIKEAKIFGRVEIVCTSKEANYSFIPSDFAVPNDIKYFHITTNNTIAGTQWHKIPKVSIPIVADMTSDMLSRVVNYNAFDLIYASAQKNAGPAGVAIVIVNKNILGRIKRNIPAILDYRNHIAADSIMSTPPVFAVYVSMLTLRWLKKMGGIAEIERLNNEKATLMYKEIDDNPLFAGTANKQDRSIMNATFTINDKALEQTFIDYTKQNGIVGLKGHRTVGGFRASMYNALPLSSVEVLVQLMKDFTQKVG
jgi:phosphoserine aminotransferase